jgi:hypothetical protein
MQSLKACMISLFNRLLFDIIHARYLLECFITILPGILLGIIYRTPLFFMASFLAIASIMPYNKSYNKKYLTLLSLLFISLFSFVFAHQPHQGSDLYWLCLLAISLTFGFLEAHLPLLKSLFSWLFIGMLYGTIQFGHYGVSFIQYLQILVVAVIGILLFLSIVKTEPLKTQTVQFKFQWYFIIRYSKYFLFLIIASSVLWISQLNQPQWFLWSGLSVLSFVLSDVTEKMKKKIIASAIGILLAYITMQLLPDGPYLQVIAYSGIALSLRGFRQYQHSLTIRCYFVVLFAGNHALAISQARFYDVFFGGIIGLLLSVILAKADAILVNNADKTPKSL